VQHEKFEKTKKTLLYTIIFFIVIAKFNTKMSYPDDCHFSYITKMGKENTGVQQPFFLLAKVHQKEKLKIFLKKEVILEVLTTKSDGKN